MARHSGKEKLEEYIGRHDFKRRWISVMLIVVLLASGVSLYAMNRGASAVTEEGAEEIGMVLDEDTEETGSEEDAEEYVEDADSDNEGEYYEESEEDSEESYEEEYEEESEDSEESIEEAEPEDAGSEALDENPEDAETVEETENAEEAELAEETEIAEEGDEYAEDELTSDVSLTVSYVDENGDLILDADGNAIADEKEISLTDSLIIPDDVRELDGYTFKNVEYEDSKLSEISVQIYTTSDDAEYKYYLLTTLPENEEEEAEEIEIKEDANLIFTYEAEKEALNEESDEIKDTEEDLADANEESSGKISSDSVLKSVDLADYVTETVIERENEDGTWEKISEADIKEGDHLRITVNYVLSKEAAASDDIHFELPSQYGNTIAQESDLDDGNGTYEISDDNKVTLQYNDEFKKTIVEEESEDSENTDSSSVTASFIMSGVLGRFFESGRINNIVNSVLGNFVITAKAAEDDSQGTPDTVPGSFVTETIVGSTGDGIKVTNVEVTLNPERDYNDSIFPYKNGTVIEDYATVQNGDMLLFKLSYEILPGTLKEDKKEIEYVLNDIKPYSEESGILYDHDNNAVGTFKVGTDGKVTFEFYDNFVKKNKTQRGYVNFWFVAAAIADADKENTTKTYDFGDNVTFTVTINKNKRADLTISKGLYQNQDDGTIRYSIYMYSQNGTGGPIKLDDIMTVFNNSSTSTGENSELTGQIDFSAVTAGGIRRSDGYYLKDYEVTGGPTSNNSFALTIPGLKENESYTLDYVFPVPDSIRNASSQIRLNNKVIATYDNDKTVSANVDAHYYTIPTIEKNGNADKTNQTVTWKIVINKEHKNLKGYTLSDYKITLKNNTWERVETKYTGKMKVGNVTAFAGTTSTLSVGDEIELGENGYTFTDDDYSTYTFTYTLNYTANEIFSGGLHNHAIIVNGENRNEVTGYAGVKKGDYIAYIAKEATGLSEVTNKYCKASWKITLKAPIVRAEGQNNNEYWTLYENLSGKQYFTDDDIAVFSSELAKIFGSDGFKITHDTSQNHGGVNGYRNLTIKVYKDLEQDATIEFSTHAWVDDVKAVAEFTNTARVYNVNYSATATQKYEPLTIEKMDGRNNSGDSSYEYLSDALYGQGILTWKIKATIPAYYEANEGTKLYIVDNLPDNVALLKNGTYNGNILYGVDVSADLEFASASPFDDGNSTTSLNGVEYTKTVDGRKITITFDASKAKGQTVYFRIHAKINDGLFEESPSHVFVNHVMLSEDGKKELANDQQKQIITNTTHVVEKDGAEVDDALNTVEYTLDINKNSADLLTEGDTLTLTDLLTVSAEKEVKASLVDGSVEVYEVAEDGTKTLLGADSYSYTNAGYQTSSASWPYNWYYSTLKFTIPDGKHLQIKYRYYFDSDKGVYVNASNKVTLEGIVNLDNQAEKNMSVKIERAGASAYIRGINLYKVDNDNTALHLEGAKFSLHYWDKNTDTWIPVSNTASEDGLYTTDESGLSIVDELTYNLAYKLVEEAAPKGYIKKDKPYYFCLKSSDTVKYEKKVPANFYSELDGEDVDPGQAVYFANSKGTTSIEVIKNWKGADGTKPGSIRVDIGRRLGTEVTEENSSYFTVNLDSRDPNNVVKMYKGFPSIKGGSKFTFSFYASIYENGSRSLPKVTINGEELDYSSEVSGKNCLITKTVTVNSDINIVIRDVTWDMVNIEQYPVTGSIEEAQPDGAENLTSEIETINREYMKNVEISEANDWRLVVDNLERYYYDKETGKTYEWKYFVSEEANMYYVPTYSENNDGGITSGTITITNTRNDVQSYPLPQTGGTGRLPFTIAGLFVATGALLLEELYRRKRKKQNR
ncbi:MAG: hypothetical protein E7301_13685 [Butyrivibrio sp.]|nr:hypothetical protein [Butyrivibrio sp.]